MKRLVAALVATLFVGMLPASAQEVYVGGGAIQWAMGAWITHKGGEAYNFYAADATRGADLGWGDVGVYLWAAKGKCHTYKGKGFTVISCSAGGRVYEGDLDDFDFDPAVSKASMRLQTNRYLHTVNWTAEDAAAPSYGGDTINDEGYVGAGAGADQVAWADPTGKLFDRKMRRRHAEFGLLYQGAGAGVIAWTGDDGRLYELRREVTGDWLDVTLTISG